MLGMMVLCEIRHRNVVHLVDADLVFCRHGNSLGWPADAVKRRSAKNKRLQKPNWKRKTLGPAVCGLCLALLLTLSLSNAADISMDVEQKCLSSTHVEVPGEV